MRGRARLWYGPCYCPSNHYIRSFKSHDRRYTGRIGSPIVTPSCGRALSRPREHHSDKHRPRDCGSLNAAGQVEYVQLRFGPQQGILSKPNAKEVWDALKALYQTRSEPVIVQLTNRFQSTKCGEEDDVRTHDEHLAGLREQLASMGKTITDEEYAGTLMGSPSYESVLSSSSYFVNQQALTSAMALKLVVESFDRRQAANVGKKHDLECLNCRKSGHVKAE